MNRHLKLQVVIGVFALIFLSWLFAFHIGNHFGQFDDLLGRRANLNNLNRTGNIYVPFKTEAFTYPPTAIAFFYPILLIPKYLLTSIWTLLSLAALCASLNLVLQNLRPQPVLSALRTSLVLTVMSALLAAPVLEGLFWGQVGTFLLLAVGWEEVSESDVRGGVLVGLATALKIYPGIFILVFILRRQWSRLFWALGTIATLLLSSYVLWPTSTKWYFIHVVMGGEGAVHFQNSHAATNNGSFVAVLERFPFNFASISTIVQIIISVAVIALSLLGGHRLWQRGMKLSSLLVMMMGSVLASPIAWDHYFVFVPLLLLVPSEVGVRSWFGRWFICVAALDVIPWWRMRVPSNPNFINTAIGFIAQSELCFTSFSLIIAAIAFGSTESFCEGNARNDKQMSFSKN